MRGTKDLRILKTERAIHQAFFGLMKKSGFEKISVKDIADAAMISRNTFYLHYNDKYDLLERVCNDMIDNLMSHVFEEINKTNNFVLDYNIDTLVHIFMLANDVISENMDSFRILVENNNSQEFISTLCEKIYASLAYIRGDIEGLSDYSLYYITGGLVSAMVHKIRNNDTENLPGKAEAFVRMHFGTLAEFIKSNKRKKAEAR